MKLPSTVPGTQSVFSTLCVTLLTTYDGRKHKQGRVCFMHIYKMADKFIINFMVLIV